MILVCRVLLGESKVTVSPLAFCGILLPGWTMGVGKHRERETEEVRATGREGKRGKREREEGSRERERGSERGKERQAPCYTSPPPTHTHTRTYMHMHINIHMPAHIHTHTITRYIQKKNSA